MRLYKQYSVFAHENAVLYAHGKLSERQLFLWRLDDQFLWLMERMVVQRLLEQNSFWR